MFSSGFQQQTRPPVTLASGLLFSQHTKKRDPLQQARKTLCLTDQDFHDLLYQKKKLGCPSFKTALKKYLVRNPSNILQLTIGKETSPTLLSFLTPYIKKVSFKKAKLQYNHLSKGAEMSKKKLFELMPKLKHTRYLGIMNSMQKAILNNMRYLTQLKTLVLTSDGRKKEEERYKMLTCHKQFNLEELTFNLNTLIDAESDLTRKPQILFLFYYLSQQKAVKSFNLTLKNCHEAVPRELAEMLQKFVFSSHLSKLRLKIPGSLSKLLAGPETSKFQAKLDVLIISALSPQGERFFSETKRERMLFVTEGFEKRETSRFILTGCTNISALYLETALTGPLLVQENNILFSNLAKFTLAVKEEDLTDFQHLETLLKHVEKLQIFSFYIDNLNLANAQRLSNLYPISLKQFSLNASTKYIYDPVTCRYLPSIIDLDLLKSLRVSSLKTIESLSISFNSQLSISIADIINELGSLKKLSRLDLYIQNQKMTQQPLDVDLSKISLLRDFRLTIYLAQGDFEILCRNLFKLESLETLHLTALNSSQARIDYEKIAEVLKQSSISQKLQDVRLKDPFKTFNFNPRG